MSRTFRRTKHRYDRDTYDSVRDVSRHGGEYWRQSVKPATEQKRYDARFHSDNYVGFSVPHAYINLRRERPARRHMKAELHRFIKNPDYDVLIPKMFRDAGWDYW